MFCEFEGAGTAQNAGAFVPCPGAGGVVELSFDVVAVIVAFHGEDAMGVIVRYCAFGLEFGAAVIGDFAVDYQVAGAALFAVLCVVDVVLNGAGNCHL